MVATLSYIIRAYPAVVGSDPPIAGRDEFSIGPFVTFMLGIVLLFLAGGVNLLVPD